MQNVRKSESAPTTQPAAPVSVDAIATPGGSVVELVTKAGQFSVKSKHADGIVIATVAFKPGFGFANLEKLMLGCALEPKPVSM